ALMSDPQPCQDARCSITQPAALYRVRGLGPRPPGGRMQLRNVEMQLAPALHAVGTRPRRSIAPGISRSQIGRAVASRREVATIRAPSASRFGFRSIARSSRDPLCPHFQRMHDDAGIGLYEVAAALPEAGPFDDGDNPFDPVG